MAARANTMSVAEYARHVGVAEQVMRRAIDAGRVTARKIKGRLRINPTTADIEWRDNTKEQHRAKPADEEPAARGDDDHLLDEEVTPENASRQRRMAEAREKIWKARLARLSYEEKTGQLVSADDIRREAYEVSRNVRDIILGIPDRLSAELCGVTDQPTMHGILTRELNRALQELAAEVDIDAGGDLPPRLCGGDSAGPAADG